MALRAPPQNLVNDFRQVYEWMIGLSGLLFEFDPSIQFTSWWRSEAENRAVGGDPQSQHLFGFAFDLVTERTRDLQNALNQVGLISVAESDHLHVQLLPAGALERAGVFGVSV